MTPVLLTLLAISLAAVAWLAARARRLTRECDEAQRESGELSTRLADAHARLELTTAERDRLRDGQESSQEGLSSGLTELNNAVAEMRKTVDGTRDDAKSAADGMTRIDGHLTGFTRRLANPQSRGAFGEEALRNQLEVLGLTEGRDFRRQVKEAGGRRRIDYAVFLRGMTIGLDPKFALDPDLDGVAEALIDDDEERLRPFARKLVARANELAKKDYWAHLEQSPSFVLMYVPVEGVQSVLSALPSFGYERFAVERGVYLVTPLQLGTTLGVIADVAHAEKRSEEIEGVHRSLIDLDQEMAKFCDHYAKHGRQLASTVASYNDGAGMLGSHGGLGRMVKGLRGYSRRLFKRPEGPRFEPLREDVAEIADAYRESALELPEMRESA